MTIGPSLSPLLLPKKYPVTIHTTNYSDSDMSSVSSSTQVVHEKLDELLVELDQLTELKFSQLADLNNLKGLSSDNNYLLSAKANTFAIMIRIREVKNEIEELYDLLFKTKLTESFAEAIRAPCPFAH